MTPRHARVYFEILTDPKFDGIREDVRHLGTWVLLLVLGEMAHPDPAFLPPQVPKRSVAALVERGLVDEFPGRRFRIHGLAAERERRSGQARDAANTRWNAVALRSQSGRNPTAMLDRDRDRERDREEVSPPSVALPRARPREGFMGVADYIEEKTGRPYSYGPGSRIHETLSADVRDFGPDRVRAVMEGLRLEKPDIGQMVFGATKRLHPLTGGDDRVERSPAEVEAYVRARKAREKGKEPNG